MSAMASRVNSPPSRQISSPKYSPTKYLSPQGSSYYAKHQQKQGHKSPIANREKPSPTKNLDTKSTFSSLVSPTGAKKGGHHRHQTSTTITGKNPQKVDRQKTSTDTENVVPLDSRLERKDRKSDQHVMFPTYETEMPTKHKSCSMNGVSVPQELLLSPGSYENSVTAGMMSKKAQSTKHWNLQAVENMDLVTIYNKQTEARKKLNTPEGSPPSKSKTLLKNKFKTTKVSPRVYELLVGSPAKQGVQKVKNNNYVKEALKDVSGIRRNGGRTGSVPNEGKEMVQGDYNEISKSPSRAKTTKYSEPNIYEDVNVYNSLFSTNNKKGSEHHVKSVQPAQDGKGDYVFSTRSAVELQETEEKGYDEDAGDQLISELMKGHALKEIKLNPNAKFLTLRKQVQERRNKMGFKSVDWNGDENIKKMLQQNRTSPTKACESSPSRSPIHSPHVMRSVEVSGSQIKDSQNLASTVGKGDDAVTKEQLMHLFQKTKVILDSYKNKECDWEKERKLFIAEIMHLRGLLEQGCDS